MSALGDSGHCPARSPTAGGTYLSPREGRSRRSLHTTSGACSLLLPVPKTRDPLTRGCRLLGWERPRPRCTHTHLHAEQTPGPGVPPARGPWAALGATLQPCSMPGVVGMPRHGCAQAWHTGAALTPGAGQTSGALTRSTTTRGSPCPGRRSPQYEGTGGNWEPPAHTRSGEAGAQPPTGSSEGEQTTRSCRLVS